MKRGIRKERKRRKKILHREGGRQRGRLGGGWQKLSNHLNQCLGRRPSLPAGNVSHDSRAGWTVKSYKNNKTRAEQ